VTDGIWSKEELEAIVKCAGWSGSEKWSHWIFVGSGYAETLHMN